jgi:SHS2 domain-containing protein
VHNAGGGVAHGVGAGKIAGRSQTLPFRFLEHTADTALELTASSDAELIAEAARGLAAVYVDAAAGAAVESRMRRELSLEAEDGESLLVDFLNELIFLFDAEGFLCAGVEVRSVDLGPPARLDAILTGETFDPARHVSLTEVKAATFHGVEIERRDGQLRTVVVLDL